MNVTPAPEKPGPGDLMDNSATNGADPRRISPARQSLKVQVTASTLLTFLVSIWVLTFYASRVMHEEMLRTAGEQQMSAATFAAAAINQELEERVASLETMATRITPDVLGNTAAAHAFLESHPVF